MWDWVQRCIKCGYCADQITKPCPAARTVIKSQEYLDQLHDPIYPKQANSFLCAAIINREAKNYSAATWALIHAAWTCDDIKRHKAQAITCRLRAAEMLLLTEQAGQQIVDEHALIEGHLSPKEIGAAILVDLLRRAGHMEKARSILVERRDAVSDCVIKTIFDYQGTLIDKNDRNCHTIDEATRTQRLSPESLEG
jgi:hypothetical protein